MKDLTRLKQKLINEAKQLHGEITPCRDLKSFDECFTIFNEKLVLWFNVASESTLGISTKLE